MEHRHLWFPGHPLEVMERAALKYGPVTRLPLLRVEAFSLGHSRLVQHVLVTNAKNYLKQTRGYEMLRLVLGNGLVTLREGEARCFGPWWLPLLTKTLGWVPRERWHRSEESIGWYEACAVHVELVEMRKCMSVARWKNCWLNSRRSHLVGVLN